MAIPALAVSLKVPFDPSDQVEYEADFGMTVLEVGETITSYTLSVGAEGVALGLSIGTGAYAPVLVAGNTSIRMWFSVAAQYREDAAFFSGLDVPITCTIVTTNNPPRTWQRTVSLRIQQQ